VTESTNPGADENWPTVDRRKLGWATDWQSTVELDKAALARSLHDNTGGLLVAAVMDITWAESRLHRDAVDVKERLLRARAALEAAINLNRRMIEDLRPTLLENFGLVAALEWHFAEACKAANIDCEQHLPRPGPNFAPPAAIALFRVAQTLIALMVSHRALALKMRLTVNRQFVALILSGAGMPNDFSRDVGTVTDVLASVTGRIKSLGGEMEFTAPPGGAIISCRLPAATALSE
jgi:signal transduction histidine kinase